MPKLEDETGDTITSSIEQKARSRTPPRDTTSGLLTPPHSPKTRLGEPAESHAEHSTRTINVRDSYPSPSISPKPPPTRLRIGHDELEITASVPKKPILKASPSLEPSFVQEPGMNREPDNLDQGVVGKMPDLFRSLVNLAIQILSRPSEARVQRAIDLIKDAQDKRCTGEQHRWRKLSAAEYRRLLERLEEPGNASVQSFLEDYLRFDYTQSKKRFEIRMPTIIHERIVGLINEKVSVWKHELGKLDIDAAGDVIAAANSIMPSGAANIELPQALGEADTQSPDTSWGHMSCELQCESATIAFEVAWTQSTQKLREKARRYICAPKSEVRVVVGLDLHDMYLAELRNQKRGYSLDQENETAQARFSVWRAVIRSGNKKDAGLVHEEAFRDATGSRIASAKLQLSLEDFICRGMLESHEGDFGEPLLISSEDLCKYIEDGLDMYRKKKKREMELELA
ncbi:hypothetical protein E0Z10_g4338 [Xylaria hypoxylon]|uniref:Uncharacterized protein n=1 Tax=Xylaria hypoxylon TaxID=37992 RepID=A0A4Z0YZ78_9PEZI|nr:hypothetical protein E0Z10_g4338 [Xylaria hypoxylon]